MMVLADNHLDADPVLIMSGVGGGSRSKEIRVYFFGSSSTVCYCSIFCYLIRRMGISKAKEE